MTDLYSIATIRKKVKEYGKKITAPKELLTVRASTDHFGTPHIEVDDTGYHFIVCERGNELERRTTKDIQTLLYWVFELIVFKMASEYELHNRKPGEDFRRVLFAKQLELFEKLNTGWLALKQKELEDILKQHPYEKT
jgi:hypothetical protein